ncbi:MAG: TonB-dependent receptor, partial [Bacteroidota bacterium]
NEPLIGANILVKGTGEGTITDFDGNFELKTSAALPFTLVISYTGYSPQEISVTDSNEKLVVKLSSDAISMDVVEVKGQRISDKQKEGALTVEALDNVAIKETASDNFYDGLGSLKGVDLTAASLGFKVINTRGFNSTSPVRSLQIIDGLDNQAPGLNFSLGNFLGSSELDVNRVEIVVGAASAFYGPNAFNGVISMETKDPFFHKGLSAMLKGGERNLVETAVRWGDAINNKNDLPFMAYKLNFSYMRADDWEAENYQAVDGTETQVSNLGGYDAVNVYGDEIRSGGYDFSGAQFLNEFPGLGQFHRTGYREIDLVDYDTRNMKASGALHFRLKPEMSEQSPELIVSTSYGTGTTVYQGDNRFSLKGITFLQNRIELKKRNKYFLRAYRTQTGAGESYDPYFTALELLERAKSDEDWARDYLDYWLSDERIGSAEANEYPEGEFDFVDGEVVSTVDPDAIRTWLEDNKDLVESWHDRAREIADAQGTGARMNNSTDFYAPGTQRFEDAFNEITGTLRTEGGTRFADESSLTHVHGEYIFTPDWMDKITVGTSGRLYTPKSFGTVFDDLEEQITNFEFGAYAGVEKTLMNEKLKAQATFRTDKNQNFRWLFSPAASLVYTPSANNYLRVSFSSAIRNPTLSDQYLQLDVGPAILAGNLEGVEGWDLESREGFVSIDALFDYRSTQRPSELVDGALTLAPVQPEQVRTVEAGYRTTLFDNTYVDASYYFSTYDNFLGFSIGADVRLGSDLATIERLQVFRYAANST